MKKSEKIAKQLNEAKARLASRLAEENNKPSDMVVLIESQIENYELIIAAKSITDTLQDMAEKASGLESDEVMPIIDGLKSAFGKEAAENFNNAATESLRNLVEAIKAAKDSIGDQILRLERGEAGLPMNDMGFDAEDNDVSDSIDGDFGEDSEDDLGELDDLANALGDDANEDDIDVAPEENAGAAGRLRKESFISDAVILESFARAVSNGSTGRVAAKMVAEHYNVDVADVAAIVRDAAKAK